MNNKIILRKKILEERKNLNIEIISKKIIEKIKENNVYKNSKNVMLFYPLKYEINLLNLLEDKKNFYLPKISGNDLLICPFNKDTELEISKFNTKEPKTTPVNIDTIDIIFVPALCADSDNYRLGYGKGYYDRLLKSFSGVSIVPISHKFLLENIPHDENDIPVDLIITESC